MSFLIQPLLDLTAPLFHIARAHTNTSREMAKLIQAVSRIGLAIGLYVIYRKIESSIEHPPGKSLAPGFFGVISFIHPYSACLGGALTGFQIALSRTTPKKRMISTIVAFSCLCAADLSQKIMHRYWLDRAIVNFSNLLTGGVNR